MKKNKNKKNVKKEEKKAEVTEIKEEKKEDSSIQTTEIETKEEKNKKGIKYNKKLLYIIPSFIVLVIIILMVITKTNVVPNLLGIDQDKTAKITNITYQGKNKYQIDSTSTFLIETKNIDKDELNKYIAIEPAYNYTIENKGKNKYEITVDNIEANKVINIDFAGIVTLTKCSNHIHCFICNIFKI